MNVIFLGPPGAGKGTQAKRLAEKHRLTHISTGDLFRKAATEGTPLGKKAATYMQRGALVPDDIVIALIRDTLPDGKGFVLDGFPRTIEQARSLDRMFQETGRKVDRVINLAVEPEELVRRLTGRRQCPNGHVFNQVSNPPRKDGVCDRCGEALTQRVDDGAETVRERLAVYRRQTEPVVDYYRRQGTLRTLDGSLAMEKVESAIASLS